jgi:hypothetical protein
VCTRPSRAGSPHDHTVERPPPVRARRARVWARLYTCGLDPDVRDRRRDELDADLWDHQADARLRSESDAAVSAVIVLRAMRGAFDDVRWRQEAVGVDIQTRRGTPMIVAPKYARWMALTAIAGAVLSAVIQLLDAGWGSPFFGGPRWAGLIISITWLFGLVALHSLHRGSVGRVGRYGFIMLFSGYALQVAVTVLWSMYAARSAAAPQPVGAVVLTPFVQSLIGLIPLRQFLTIGGWVLLGIGTIRARLLPEQFVRLPLMLGCLAFLNVATSMGGALGMPEYSVAAALLSPGSLFRVALNLAYALAIAGLAYAVWSLNRPGASASRPAGALLA